MAGRGAVTAFGDHCEWTGASAHNREEWLISRRAGIGGSDVAAVLGKSRYKSALELYVEKTSDDPPTEESSEIARWGQLFEPQILKEFAGRTGRRVVKGGKLMRSKRAAHHLITLDGVQFTKPPQGGSGPGVAEVKTTGFTDRFDDAAHDGTEKSLPLDVRIQVQWELSVTGANWGTCIWLPFPERKLQWIDVLEHREFQAYLIEEVDSFWKRVRDRRPPDPDGSDSSMRALRLLYPDENNEVIRIPGREAVSLAEEYERCRAASKMLAERASLIKQVFALTLGKSKYGLLDDERHWRTAAVGERTSTCQHCNGVLSTTRAYRSYTFCEPRKKPFHKIDEVRQLATGVSSDPALEKHLAASLVGSAPAENDSAEQGAAE